jgi:Tfp pilus assembly protein FimT
LVTGTTLIECLVYISVVAIVVGIGSMTLWRCWDANKALRRDADDIVHALHTGEQWRADVREATGPIRSEVTDGSYYVSIPTQKGEIVYTLLDDRLHRRLGSGGRDPVVLNRVKSSKMRIDRRDPLTAWRWELELQPVWKRGQIRPLFTFLAVPRSTTLP